MRNALGYMNLDGYLKEHTAELKSQSDYSAKLKQVTTYIRLHLSPHARAAKFDKKTLEAIWVFFVLKRLPLNFAVFRTLQFASFKIPDAKISMSRFLKDLENEAASQAAATA
ncbi:hypothetical protein VP01_6397g1 [Puccinia sorghi]|uniref:Uncharacterized protein n=1 Tax=Puccinia sorghi TaxID=27349 RepID=A0A0L6UI12_9BASI|nr:hypothetical protein VP01_6397g1 [Puccinia sorghi]